MGSFKIRVQAGSTKSRMTGGPRAPVASNASQNSPDYAVTMSLDRVSERILGEHEIEGGFGRTKEVPGVNFALRRIDKTGAGRWVEVPLARHC